MIHYFLFDGNHKQICFDIFKSDKTWANNHKNIF